MYLVVGREGSLVRRQRRSKGAAATTGAAGFECLTRMEQRKWPTEIPQACVVNCWKMTKTIHLKGQAKKFEEVSCKYAWNMWPVTTNVDNRELASLRRVKITHKLMLGIIRSGLIVFDIFNQRDDCQPLIADTVFGTSSLGSLRRRQFESCQKLHFFWSPSKTYNFYNCIIFLSTDVNQVLVSYEECHYRLDDSNIE